MIGLAVLGALGACGDGSTNGSTTPTLTVTADINAGEIPSMANAVKANGSNVISINVVGGTKAPITVRTKKGSFEGGVQSIAIDSLSGSVDLTVCDAHNDTAGASTNCAGSVTVTATDAAGANGKVTLKFIGYETACTDGADNNGDGRTDCADPDCDQATCTVNGAAGTCKNSTCTQAVCTPSSSTEVCNNNVDDNCDGKIDCAESACDGQPCKAGSPTFVCQSSVCTDLASGLALTVTPARARLPADGTTTTTVTAKLLKDGQAQANTLLTFTTNLGGFVVGSGGAPPKTTTAKTDSDGTATVAFVSDTTDGVVNTGIASITASVNSSVTATGLITIPALGSIKVASIQNQVMGVKYSGWNEQNVIKVALLDTEQKPYPDGLKVRFEHQQLSGSKISSPWTTAPTTCLEANNCLGYETVTTSPSGTADSDGIAAVNLYSGTAAGLVAVKVSAAAGGASRDFAIQDIAIIGAKASGAHFSLECTPRNVPGFWGSQCLFTEYDGAESPVKCTARFADRFNNVLGKATLVTFNSEAGSAGPPTSTAQYDASKLTDQTKDLGFAADSIAVTGYGLPADVDPLTDDGEQSWTESSGKADRCGYLTHNQRDGLVTIIAMAKGEEGFVDINGNGVWDSGEPFIDQGEPFVDANDNGKWDSGEYFIDLNGNGVYDKPNGVWDSDTTIWTETRVLYTGTPDRSFVTPAALTVDSSAGGQPPSTASASFVFQDMNLNSTSPLASPSSNFSAVSELGYTTTKIVYTPSTVDSMGLVFTRQYCGQKPGSTATTCSSTCEASPCLAVPTVSGYGSADANAGLLSVTGGSVANANDVIDISIKMDNVTFIGASKLPVHVN